MYEIPRDSPLVVIMTKHDDMKIIDHPYNAVKVNISIENKKGNYERTCRL